MTQALNAVEKERDKLASELHQAKLDTQTAAQLAEMTRSKDLQEAAATKDTEIQALKSQLASNQANQKLAIHEAVGSVEKQRDALQNSLHQTELQKQLAETSLKDKYETQLKDRDDAIERLRDMKAKLSTKMVGETLEQHCETEFNRLRATAFTSPISKKTTAPQRAARAITSSVMPTMQATKSSRSCSR